ncbi:MAG: RsmB/NOP family class I SAM-dependent RNA methyltransferase [Promethearchaeota archaeon]
MDLLVKFIKGDSISALKLSRKKSYIVHYYYEIVRYWNKINFIIKRILPNSITTTPNQLALYLYITYRLLWEKASDKTILKEVKKTDKKFLSNLRNFSWDKSLKRKDLKEKLSINEAIPTFMIYHLLPVIDLDFIKRNIQAMNGGIGGDRTFVRINRLLKKSLNRNINQIIKSEFDKEKITFDKDPHIEGLLSIPTSMKNNVLKNPIYQKGHLIFQDKASAAVIEVLSPQPGEFICDMCAAPGMKTSLIAQNMDNKGRIIAGEFLNQRSIIMKNLLSHLGVLNTHILNTDSIVFPLRFHNIFDRILLDAPCTGNGTFLTNPELKWRQNENFLHQNTLLQKKLLENALTLVRPNGIIVYSTCSLYPEEGEHIIMSFQDYLEPQNLPDWFSPSYNIKGSMLPGTGRLFPSIHHTQGFFIGKFKKKEI